CFDSADDAARRGNFDYAIALYLEGLRCTPDDVERGHKAMYEAAVRRRATGKKQGWGAKTARLKSNVLQMAGKKKEAFLEMEKAMAGTPDSHLDLAALAQMSFNLGLQDTPIFFAGLALETAHRAGKASETLCVQMATIYEARERFRRAMEVLSEAENLDKTKSGRHMKHIRDLAARTTIDMGLEEAESFHDRIKDQGQARDSAMQQVRTAEDELVAKAEGMAEELKQNPNDLNLIIAIGDTYARAGRDDEAMQYYRKARAASGGADYRIKVKMDDLRMRQFRQQMRALEEQLKADPDNEELKAKLQELAEKRNQAEMSIFEERSREYPTDMSVRYELGLREFRCGLTEKAIGSFQNATRDPKHKVSSLNMLGKCFFKSKLLQEAAAQFRAAMDSYELQGDPIWKELRYNLGMTYEAMKKLEEATNCYSEIVMSDFQYRDAAKRLSKLREELEGEMTTG
ncbi:MAG: tetratricopeptide repeat protein, partial [Anaerolineaceae bacterium]|nr:tetratricopeptide repeat protein [Anaerolineaceae bacterium]